MDDSISRQAAIDAADRADYTGLAVEDVKKVTDEVVKELKQLPTIDPVKHGKWKNRQMHDEELMPISVFRHRCSVCNFEINTTEETIWWRWCPGCGARMDADDWEEPKINPCRGCEDYDGRGGCTSHGACVAEMSEE